MTVDLYLGDCLDILSSLEAESVDTVITDPPSGITFMGKLWDNLTDHRPRTERSKQAWLMLEGMIALGYLQKWEAGFLFFTVDWATQTLRVAKPGAMGIVWAIPRTSDLTKFGLRLAGWEIRDTIYHLFGSGFPKSHNVAGAIDRSLGYGERGHRIAVASRYHPDGTYEPNGEQLPSYVARSDEAGPWTGYSTALKPAVEEWIVAMKPLDGTFAANALEWGVAGLWVDGCRVATNGENLPARKVGAAVSSYNAAQRGEPLSGKGNGWWEGGHSLGRWPANLAVTHHPMCQRAGSKRVKGNGHFPGARSAPGSGAIYGGGRGLPRETGTPEQYLRDEEVPAWECAEDCPVRTLDAMSGERPGFSGGGTNGAGFRDSYVGGSKHERSLPAQTFADTGGASRFYHCPDWSLEAEEGAAWDCHPDCPIRALDEQSGELRARGNVNGTRHGHAFFGNCEEQYTPNNYAKDAGGASRFYHCPDWSLEAAEALAGADPARYVGKAHTLERNAGLMGFFWKNDRESPTGYTQIDRETWLKLPKEERRRGNVHSTIKPLALLVWLARLLLPPEPYAPRRLLVPFAGVGSEVIGALLAGWEDVIGVELLEANARMARVRIAWWEAWAASLGTTDPGEVLRGYRERKSKGAQGDRDVSPPPPRPRTEQLALWT